MELFSEGGLRDEGGTVEPESGNEVPSGSLQKEVADDIPIMISEGEFVFPADVVRYIGLNTLMKMRQDAKQGLKMMEKMGQMGNPEEAELPDDIPFGMADLIVIGSDDDDKDEKAEGGMIEMQTGGLLDDPRFSDPAVPSTPTLTEEDKKEIEDSLLGTAYGDITMRRYVNAEGDVKYIPFIGDEPQMPIPEGYEPDNSAPKTPSLVGQVSGDDGGRGGDSGSAEADIFTRMQMEQDRALAMRDKPQRKPIEEWTEEELLAHYESFSNPMNRFLVPIVGALFGGLPALAIAGMQQYNLANGPYSLKRTEELLSQKFSNLDEKQRERLTAARKIVKEKGVTGFSLVKNIIQKISGKKDSPEENALDKAIASGKSQNVARTLGAITGDLKNIPISKPSVIDGQTEFTLEELIDDPSYFTPEEIAQTPLAGKVDVGFQKALREQPAKAGVDTSMTDNYMAEAFGSATPQTTQTVDLPEAEKVTAPTLETPAMTDPRTGADPIAVRMGTAPTDDLNIDMPDTTERARRISREQPLSSRVDQGRMGRGRRTTTTTGEEDLLNLQSQVKAQQEKMQKESENLRKRLEDVRKKTSMGTEYGRQRVSDDEDRDDGGPSGPVFGDGSFQTELPSYAQPSFTPAQQSTAYTQSAISDFQDRPEQFGFGGRGFYVGGVPTKPMKPQRLKKGGLAKPKVKPKRMKKGGLASKKK